MKSADIKTVGLVVAGIIVAGWIMYFGRDIALLKNATEGYDA